MNRFENMDTFVKVVEAGTISAAADRLAIAKSAVSRRLKELEEHLGVELFHRTTRKMNLTDTGRSYYQQCVRILDDVIETELCTSQAHETIKGTLKVALPSSFGLLHMGSAVNDFLQRHPHIEFDLDFNDRLVDVVQDGFDLAIRIAELDDSSLIARKLASIHAVICASPDYLRDKGEPTTPQELSKHQCLVYTLLRNHVDLKILDPQGKLIKVRLDPYIRASTGEFLKDMAVAGNGIVALPTFIAYKAIEQGTLVPLLSEYRLPSINAYAVYPQTRHLSQRVRTFVDFLAERFEGQPYWDKCLEQD